ncbi:hypothetical protein AALB39_12425 [Lachnospiraceae bacterium 54-53]
MWEVEIELLSKTEIKRGARTHYPYVTDGKGIIEYTSPYVLAEIVEITDKNGTLSQIAYMYSGEEHEWEFRDFNLE